MQNCCTSALKWRSYTTSSQPAQPIHKPRLYEWPGSLADSKLFQTSDYSRSYWKINRDVVYHNKPAFTFWFRACKILKILNELWNGPDTREWDMDVLLSTIQLKFAPIYLDNFIMFSYNTAEHEYQVGSIFLLLHITCFKLNIRKCKFFTKRIEYLWLVI